MNYQTLTQRLSREVGSNAPILTVAGGGETRLLAGWVASAWEDLQLERPDWYWMRGSFSFTTTQDDGDYSSADAGIASRFAMWDLNSVKCYQNSVNDELKLTFLPYQDFRDSYLVGVQSSSRPYNFSVAPDLKLLLGPKPNGTYTVSGEYFKTPQELTADADVPELPEQFHMAIVYRAMMLYARYEAAPELYSDGEANYRRFLRRIEYNQLPTVEVAGTLT